MQIGSYKFLRFCGFVGIVFVSMFSIATSFGMRSGIWRSMGKVKPLMASSQFTTITKKNVLNHPSFEVMEDFNVKEYGFHGSILKHRQSGAQVISVITPDENKVFGITFRTPPSDR